MGVLAELDAQYRARLQSAGVDLLQEAGVEVRHHHEPVEVPEPATGQVYRDRFNVGFSWRVQWADSKRVFLRMRNPAGEPTESYLDWPRDRWAALVDQQGFELVSDGD